MKLKHKLSLLVILLLSVVFSAGGLLLVRAVFNNAMDEAVAHGTEAHAMQRYLLESELLRQQQAGDAVRESELAYYAETLVGYLGGETGWLALYGEQGGDIYAALPPGADGAALLAELAPLADGCVVREVGERRFLFMASAVETEALAPWLLSAYDVTSVFAQRGQNLTTWWRLEAVLLAVSAVGIFVLAAFITRPINRLNEASRRMAAGSYAERVSVRDGGEIGQLADSFNRMAEAVEGHVEQLSLSLRQRDDFVAAFTHEIKTPMTSLVGYANLMRTTECAPQVRQQAMTAIYHEAKRLEALSQKLLALMGLGEKDVELEAVDLGDIFRRSQRSTALALDGVRVHYVPAEGIQVLADGDLILDLLQNLVINAARAKPKDGAVQVGWRLDKARCTIAVRDTGRGIPAEELARITEPFYTVDKSRARAQGGSGLGLALGQRIAQAHGTKLGFKSSVGKGTTVWFSLALAKGGEGHG